VPQVREQEGVLCAGQCLRGDLQEELTTQKGETQVKHGRLTLTVATFGLTLCLSTGAMDSVQAGQHSRVNAAAHHAKAYTGRKVVCYVTRNRATHKARKVCRPVGGYSRLTARRVLWGPAGMPPAPKDFGPHFDFPAHSLNSGPTEAPYPGW
jgi:hypothetical protein